MICEKCSLALQGDFDYGSPHHEDAASLMQGVESGCAICTCFYHALDTLLHLQKLRYPLGPGSDTVVPLREEYLIYEDVKFDSNWLNGCDGTHQKCSHNNQPTVYPTGLLELGESKGLNPGFIRLEAASLTNFRQAGIQHSDLPRAFVESGPGSTQDWRSESAKMHDVYSNRNLNVSLSGAANPN
ncbi:hypothetical protein B0T26DRAFT_748537 [Lasiosphaeria miniovina]|uniref:Uncharacterized protein n=1 Tax=Lasiosphaeria miniovina TaxID=1954250 RepID=A0AA40E5Z7_9PEZI|nr:uncharacterized protein B0T26DRAFT_748537 [Lasiosphaeria miniovina]KAK0728300.1 hypothetical protein B0T26DRAFT_748537 [Lasiosphaeria miniovina]